MALLADFILPVSTTKFKELFLVQCDWYKRFLFETLNDLEVNISHWEPVIEGRKFSRVVKSLHPSQVSFPGLPSHAESRKVQVYEVIEGSGDHALLTLNETDNLTGIPYSDYFSVHTDWKISPKKLNSGNKNDDISQVVINLSFTFHKSTWLQGTIESNSRAELRRVCELWLQNALTYIATLPESELGNKVSLGSYRLESSAAVLKLSCSNLTSLLVDDGQTVPSNARRNSSASLSSPLRLRSRTERNNRAASLGELSDDEFFDCEDLPEEFQEEYSDNDIDIEYEDDDRVPLLDKADKPLTTRDVAVAIVESLLVLMEFSFWSLYSLYMYEMKDIFDVTLRDVFQRIIAVFIPARHSIITRSPDLYGPVISVLLLPQVLLISIGLSRHGCSSAVLLGNAVIVTLCIWVGLSALYRLLSYFILPWMGWRHCLSLVGYSFFAWSFALLFRYPLEVYHHILLVYPMVPIVLFGLPAAVAQGYIFWEYAPNSSIFLKGRKLNRYVERCFNSNWSCAQAVLSKIPKIFVFILVSGTHYQLLWYLTHVFLPGTRQMCRLSSLINPSNYAEILAQKELLNFAAEILGESEHTQ